MELQRLLRVVVRWWWLPALGALVAGTATFALTAREPAFYEAAATMVVLPRATEGEDSVRAIGTLNRGAEIRSTFATIAESGVIERRARNALGDDVSTRGISVAADVIAGTNVIEVRSTGPDPEAVAAYTQAIVDESIAYTDTFDDVFHLQILEPPRVPNRAAGPDSLMDNVLGLALGFLVGGILALLAEFMSDRGTLRRSFDIVDPETLAFRPVYLSFRVQQELARSRRTGRSFSVGLLRVDVGPGRMSQRTARVRDVVEQVMSDLRPEDDVAHLGDHVLAVLLPETPATDAELRLLDLCDRLAETTTATSAVFEYDGSELEEDVSLDSLREAV